jgi:hypothetical protein
MESTKFVSQTWKTVHVFPITKTFNKAVYVIAAPLRPRVIEQAGIYGFTHSLENGNELIINFN